MAAAIEPGEEVSLQQFKTDIPSSLLWNCHDNVIAVLGESSIYILTIKFDGSFRQTVLHPALGSSIKTACWSESPFLVQTGFGLKSRMILFVLFHDGTLMAWSEVSSSLVDRWSCLAETKLETEPSSMTLNQNFVYVGSKSGTLDIFSFDGNAFQSLASHLIAEGESITRLAVSETGHVAVSHGFGQISIFNMVSNDSHVCIADKFGPVSCLQWRRESLYVVKYNQIYKYSATLSQKELFSAETELEAFSDSTMTLDKENIFFSSFSGNLYRYKVTDEQLTKIVLQEADRDSRCLGVQVSSSGRTVVMLIKNPDNLLKILFYDLEMASPSPPVLHDSLVWESMRYDLAEIPPPVLMKKALLSPVKDIRDSMSKEIGLVLSDHFSKQPDGIDTKLSKYWLAYKKYLQDPSSKWAALKGLETEECPDCHKSPVLLDSFTEAKCQDGHFLTRCSATFRCIGTLDPFEKCEDCGRVYSPGIIDTCHYCHGRLFPYI